MSNAIPRAKMPREVLTYAHKTNPRESRQKTYITQTHKDITTHTHTHTHTHAHAHACTHARAHTHTHARTHARTTILQGGRPRKNSTQPSKPTKKKPPRSKEDDPTPPQKKTDKKNNLTKTMPDQKKLRPFFERCDIQKAGWIERTTFANQIEF